MLVALAVEGCVGLAPLWKWARVENVYNVGHRRERNGSAGSDGCYEGGREFGVQMCKADARSRARQYFRHDVSVAI